MKRLRDITTRASLHELVEALIEATVVDGETTPEVKPEGEKEFVKLHKTEKHTDPDRLGNPAFSHKVKEAPYKKAPKDNGFPKEVKEETELDEAHPAWPNKSRHPSMRKPAKPIGKKKSGKWEAREDDQGNVFFRRVGSKKWDTTRRTDEELDESGAIAKAKGKAVLISRPKFDARGNVILTKNAKANITVGKKPRKLSGKNWEPGKKRFGEEKEQLDELSPATLGRYIKGREPGLKVAAYSLGSYQAVNKQDWAQHHLKQMDKYSTGIRRAADRISGTYEVGKERKFSVPGDESGKTYSQKRKKIYHAEETQLDELKLSTLRSFRLKAKEKENKIAGELDRDMFKDTTPEEDEANNKKVDKMRQWGYAAGKAEKRLLQGKMNYRPGGVWKKSKPYIGEEEQLDELSTKTLKNVEKTARKVANREDDLSQKYGISDYEKAWKADRIAKKAQGRIKQTGKFKFYKTDEKNRNEETQLDEKAVSKAQQRFMGMAYAIRKGESDRGGEEVTRAAADMSTKELRKFAKTKHKGLPERKGK